MKIVEAALLAGLVMAAAAQRPPAIHSHGKNLKAAADYHALIDSYFPFHPGDVRTYVYRGETADGPGPNPPTRIVDATYTETVVSVRDVTPVIRVVQLEIRGSQGADHSSCSVGPLESDPDEPVTDPSSFWYIFAGRYVFTRCNQDDANNLIQTLRAHGPHADDPYREGCRPWCNEYILPLKVGRSWGSDGEKRLPGDTRWEWFVAERETVSVPGGTFKGCFRLIYETNPDDKQLWICPGAGLLADEYTHHGSLMHYRIELTGITTQTPGK